MLTVSYTIALLPWTVYPNMLPSKSLLHSVGTLDIIVVTQKLIQGILLATLPDSSLQSQWICSCASITMSLAQMVVFVTRIQNYSLVALRVKGHLTAVTLALSVAILACNFACRDQDDMLDLTFMFVLTIMFAAAFVKVTSTLKMQKIIAILTSPPNKISPEELIYKIGIYKQLKKKSIPAADYRDHVNLYSLYFAYQDKIELQTDAIQDEDKTLSLSQKLKAGFAQQLQDSLSKHPRSDILKLFCTYYFSKKRGAYTYAAKLIEVTQKKSTSYKIRLNALIQRQRIHHYLFNGEHYVVSGLHFNEFIRYRMQLIAITKGMMEQKTTQIEIYKQCSANVIDAGKVKAISVKVELLRERILGRLRKFEDLPEYYSTPMIIAAHYMLRLNFSLYDYEQYMNKFRIRMAKKADKLQQSKILRENLDSKDSIGLELSAKEETLGQILFCSPNVFGLLGQKAEFFTGRKILSLTPSCLRDHLHQDLKVLLSSTPSRKKNRSVLTLISF